MTEIQSLIDEYYAWLKDKTAWQQVNEQYTEITTPYLDRHNDYIQFYLAKTGSSFFLTDAGETITALEQEGVSLSTSKQQTMLATILNGHGIQKEKNALTIQTSRENFAVNKHSLIQAILAIQDMFYLASSRVSSTFLELVSNWLDNIGTRFVANISFVGKTGLPCTFDFIIPKSSQAPERIIKTINNLTKNSLSMVIMNWIDTRNTRPKDSIPYVFLNDEHRITPKNKTALENYQMHPTLWNQRGQLEEALIA